MKDENEILYKGEFLQIIRRNHWEWVDRVNCTDIVIILPITDEKKIILVEQYRIPLASNVIEFPAGLVGDGIFKGESVEEGAKRELLEETGYQAEHLTYLTRGPISSGLCSEVISIFLAKNIKKVSAGGGDKTENILVHEVPLSEINTWLDVKSKEGMMIDPKVYAGLYFLMS